MRKLLVVMVLLAAGPVLAHHQFASEFDVDKPVKLKGTITKFMWTNPHGWLYIDAQEIDGKTLTTATAWALEFGGPSQLLKNGWRKTDLPVGTVVTVDAYRAKNGTNTANAYKVIMPTGKALFAGSSLGEAN